MKLNLIQMKGGKIRKVEKKTDKKSVEIRFRCFNTADKTKIENMAKLKGLTASSFARTLVYEALNQQNTL